MKFRQLADTGVFVSELCLGAMTFGGRGQQWQMIGGLGQNEVDGIVHRALEGGVNFIDTADVYSAGESETLLGRALAGRRQEVVLATKVRGRMGSGPNQVGLSRLHIIEAVDASLKRLNTDYIDLYQIHRFDALTNLEDTLRALDDLVRTGKVRYIGCSNLGAWQMMKSLAISREQRLERFRCTQSYYSLVGRELEREIVPFLKDQGLGLLVWSPLAGGFLSGKFTRTGGDEAARRGEVDFSPGGKERGFALLRAGAAGEVRFPAGRQGERLRHSRRADGDREGARRDGPTDCARVDSRQPGGHERDHRRAQDGAARGQPEGDRRHADRRRHEDARRGEQDAAGLSGLDGFARFGSPSWREAVLMDAPVSHAVDARR